MTPDFQIAGEPQKTRIVVAMSGGVDSSVAAALAKRAGYDVVGITLQLYNHGEAIQRKGACCAGSDIHDARTVAAKIGIPHFVLDYETRFREQVIEPFADSYARGETPVPCISCNQTVKFKDLLATAKDLGGAALVTGHYIESRSAGNRRANHRAMYRAHDADRDQSYFLYATTQEQLDYLRFPLGGLAKPAVRAIAEELGLPVANKPDSQDICFVPSGRYTTIIDRLKPNAGEPGEIVHLDGRVLGRHQGIIHYTVGQRRGLNIAEGEPLYVIGLDAKEKRVIVGPREALLVGRARLRDINWLADSPLAEMAAAASPVYARVRSTRQPVPAFLHRDGNETVIDFPEGEEGVAPGQACVLYDSAGPRARVLGGGVITGTLPIQPGRGKIVPLAQPAAAVAG